MLNVRCGTAMWYREVYLLVSHTEDECEEACSITYGSTVHRGELKRTARL